MRISRYPISITAFAALMLAGQSHAEDIDPDFYEAALCNPAYTISSATELYNAAEKLAKPDTSLLTAYVYKLTSDIGKDGFKSDELVFAGSSFGVLVEGERAEALAARYQLKADKSTIFGTATKNFTRALPDAEQPTVETGLVSIVARESPALPGKTLLACELVSHADAQALKAIEGSK